MNKLSKISLSFLLLTCLCACKEKETLNNIKIDSAKYPTGYELSLGFGLPTIKLEEDYDDWDLNNSYFGGKKVDEAYIPKYNTNENRIVVYRNKIEENISLEEFANNSITNNAYDKTQNVSLIYFNEDVPYAYYSVIKEIDGEKYLAQEYFYLGTMEYVNLEYLSPMIVTNIADSELCIYVPANYNDNYLDGYIAAFYDDNNFLPSIYISREEIAPEYIKEDQGEYITPYGQDDVINFDDFNYEDLSISNNSTNTINYHVQLNNYLNNIYELFDVTEENYSSLKYQETDIETLNLKYTYINNETRYIAYETNIGIGNYIYTICLCAYEDLPIQNANAKLLSNTICFK